MRTPRTLISLVVVLLLSSCGDKALRYYNLGVDAMDSGDLPAAIDYFEKSIGLRPDDPDTHVNLGVAYHQAGKYKEALAQFKVALDYYPGDPTLHFNMAETYASMEAYQSARREYELAIRLDNRFHQALAAYGKLLLDTDHFEEAEEKALL
jgi:tetratricopeptide (TPR) repeat protein